ncbi:hypothetical protein EOD42_03025 [Rhodovarius crocodyli]|uniref:Uncharacterized protein n=1 Tax=Rhodovarius crocodyli TaxID=1979269 RepID=A0A437MN67_9PROT|nr:hypothetical protein [Rhodovarius crocodyli]RVT99094.1 hypothetical protein EOD42_03025 [Rhodovarius crocodyli]
MSDSILTVITPAPDRLLATAADVAAQLGLSNPPPGIGPLILRASDAIAGACNGRVFGRETVRETFRLSCPLKPLMLARDRVHAIASVVVDGTTLVEGADFEVDGPAGLLHRLSGDARCAWRAAKVVVEYSAGWLLPSQDDSDLPGDVRGICIDRAARAYLGQGEDLRIRSESAEGVGNVSYFDPDKLSTPELVALAPYHLYRL